jgi:group I intron endonuclease
MSNTIYKLTHINNGKIYIGSTTNLKARLAYHKHQQIHSCGTCLGNAINQDGWYAFYVEVLDIVDTQLEGDFLEKKYIAEYNSNDIEFGYNRNKGSRGTVKGTPKSVQHRMHMSDSARGKPKSEQHKQAMSLARLGKKFPRS